MKKNEILALWVLLINLVGVVSCTEQVDESARYVCIDRTITDYLSEHEQYSEYLNLLSIKNVSSLTETTLKQLLSARGHYTVFAPTNEAIQTYLEELTQKGITDSASWNGFRDEESKDSIMNVVVMNSIVNSGDDRQPYMTYDFPIIQDAEFPLPNMYDRRLVVHHAESSGQTDYTIAGSPIHERNRDIVLLNGVIHCVTKVVAPSNNTLGYWLSDILKYRKEGYHVAALLAQAVGLLDSLNQYRDFAYETRYEEGSLLFGGTLPEHRYYGYTYFAETDSTWSRLLGKPAMDITVKDVTDYLAASNLIPDAVNNMEYGNEENLLNQFVTYHLLPRKLSPNHLVYHYNELGYNRNTGELGVAMCEYYTTMGKRRLMKIYESRESQGIYLNRFPVLDNGRHGTYHELSCDPGKKGILIGQPNLEGENSLRNAYVYPLEDLFVYDQQAKTNLGKERIRIDVAAISPEMNNNDLRMSVLNDVYFIAPDYVYKYFDDWSLSDDTRMIYNTARTYLPPNYGNDEFLIYGVQDYILRLPPVPVRDTYEVRYACSNVPLYVTSFQIYFGEDPDRLPPCGIPLDFRQGGLTYISGEPSHMGWEQDTEDDDYNAEIDKRLRNNGFMKAPNIYYSGSDPCRRNHQLTRRILVKQTMDPEKTYYLRMKACYQLQSSQLFMDFIEFCPKSVYDNPSTPEDIW